MLPRGRNMGEGSIPGRGMKGGVIGDWGGE